MIVSALFSILGWRLSHDKLVEYFTIYKVLGVQFDLRMSGDGLAYVANTNERVVELCENSDEILRTKHLNKADGERLRGRLLFATGQLFGRRTRNLIRILSAHVQRGRKQLEDGTLNALASIRDSISNNVPRKILGSLTEHVHVYVDASLEEAKYSGIGGVLYDMSGTPVAFFSEEILPDLIEEVKAVNQVSIIQELEMFAFLAALCHMIENRRVVVFTDSESVRGSFLKTWSQNAQCSFLLRQIFQLEAECLCQVWLERVPSQSNPADVMSREVVTAWMSADRFRLDCKSLWREVAIPSGVSARQQ